MHRWVRYEAPVMVCVAIDDDGSDRVINVVIGEELEDLHAALGAHGQALVYDEHMELLDPADLTGSRAVRVAEDRNWPKPEDWEGGPDPLRYPGLYDPVDEEDDEDLEPLDLDEPPAIQNV
jgi:hypothetical protein